MAKKRQRSGGDVDGGAARHRVRLDYETALSRVIHEAVRALTSADERPAGTRRIVNYLRGNQAPPDLPGGVESCHGALADHGAAWLRQVVEGLVEEGFLDAGEPPRSSLELTVSGRRLLRGDDRLVDSVVPRAPVLGRHPEREGGLSDLRRRLAAAEGRPTFSIFDNTTLAWLADRRPRTLADLASTPGFGPHRLEKYGRKVLAVLRRM